MTGDLKKCSECKDYTILAMNDWYETIDYCSACEKEVKVE